MGNVERAIELYKFHLKKNEHFQLDYLLCLQMIHGLIDVNRIDCAKGFLSEITFYRSNKSHDETSAILISIFKNLNSKGAEIDEIQRFVDSLIFTRKYVKSAVLEVLMQIYLEEKKNFLFAVQLFEQIGHTFNRTCYFQSLLNKLIEHELVDDIEKVIQVSQRIHGRQNTILTMACSFVECHRIDQANKIFQSFDINQKESYFLNTIAFFKSKKKPQFLRNLLKALENCDSSSIRKEIYVALIEMYAYENKCEDLALMCSEMDRENIILDEETLNRLTKLFQQKGLKTPAEWAKKKINAN